jgi:hypothetical protein
MEACTGWFFVCTYSAHIRICLGEDQFPKAYHGMRDKLAYGLNPAQGPITPTTFTLLYTRWEARREERDEQQEVAVMCRCNPTVCLAV